MNKKQQNVLDVFNVTAKSYVEHFGDDMEFENEIEAFADSNIEGAKILDLGSGSGYLTDLLQKRGLRPIGIDFCDEMINISKGRYPDSKFLKMDMLDIDKYFPEDYFDGVLAIYILYFIPREEIDRALQALSRVVKKGGKMLIVTQSGNGEQYISETLMPDGEGKEALFVNLYPKEELFEILQRNGFEVETFSTKANIDEDEIPGEGRYVLSVRNEKIKEHGTK